MNYLTQWTYKKKGLSNSQPKTWLNASDSSQEEIIVFWYYMCKSLVEPLQHQSYAYFIDSSLYIVYLGCVCFGCKRFLENILHTTAYFQLKIMLKETKKTQFEEFCLLEAWKIYDPDSRQEALIAGLNMVGFKFSINCITMVVTFL